MPSQSRSITHAPHQAVRKNFFELDYPPELAAKLQRQIQEVIGCLRSAVTVTLQHAQIGAPRTDCVTILVSDHAA